MAGRAGLDHGPGGRLGAHRGGASGHLGRRSPRVLAGALAPLLRGDGAPLVALVLDAGRSGLCGVSGDSDGMGWVAGAGYGVSPAGSGDGARVSGGRVDPARRRTLAGGGPLDRGRDQRGAGGAESLWHLSGPGSPPRCVAVAAWPHGEPESLGPPDGGGAPGGLVGGAGRPVAVDRAGRLGRVPGPVAFGDGGDGRRGGAGSPGDPPVGSPGGRGLRGGSAGGAPGDRADEADLDRWPVGGVAGRSPDGPHPALARARPRHLAVLGALAVRADYGRRGDPMGADVPGPGSLCLGVDGSAQRSRAGLV